MRGTIEQGSDTNDVIASYGRSGTNMMINAIRMNFGPRLAMTHGLIDTWVGRKHNIVYMVRDPRNVLVSYYRLLKKGALHFSMIEDEVAPLDFHQMLRGEWVKPLTGCRQRHGEIGRVVNDMLPAPAAAWAKHAAGYRLSDDALTVKYEDLVADYDNTMVRVGKYLGHAVPDTGTVPVEGFVGPLPGEGSPEGWKEYFSDEDLSLVMKEAGDEMKEWGYE